MLRNHPQWLLLGVLVVIGVISAFSGSYSPYYLDIAVMCGINVTLAVSLNLINGYTGQFSLGHAAFFGVGLYASFILQVNFGLSAWLALAAAIVAGAVVGLALGFISFRYGLRGSYFALVTLAFAEVFRVIASVADITGGGQGKYLPTRVGFENLQFGTKAGYFYFALALFVIVQLAVWWIARGRLGARFLAIREDEEAAAALTVNVLRHKLIAIAISGAIAGCGGFFYGQYYFYVDPAIAFGPLQSVEILLVAIIGGMGTIFGPVVGAVVLRVAGEITQSITGTAPGINLVLYGIVVIVIVRFMPNGLLGGIDSLVKRFGRLRQGGLARAEGA